MNHLNPRSIVEEGEEVTELAIAKFAELFQGKLPPIAVSALRALFRLDCDLASAVEDALVLHGGATSLDQEVLGSAGATADV